MKTTKMMAVLILSWAVPALACDPQACVAKAKELTRSFGPIKGVEDKARALEFLDLHKTCACGVLEGSYAKVYPSMADTAAGRLKKFDGTNYDMAWLKDAEAKSKSQKSVDQKGKTEADRLRYEKMVTEIKATSDWSGFSWTFAGTAYESSKNPCKPASADEHLKHGCSVEELYADKGILFLSCPASFDNAAFGVAGFYKDKATCERCFPRRSVTATNRFPDTNPRCFDGLAKKFGK
ncbi:MAG: hypothetical protein KF681_15980 [Bdellovibrionaceae bacterium]|nr:hypothetical protein [Pseudobdellovibrionaceae bacterium]